MRLMRFVINGKKRVNGDNNLDVSLNNILNDIRNYKQISPDVLSHMKTDFDAESKMKVIIEYRKCMAALVDACMLEEDYDDEKTITFVGPYSENY